MKSVRKNVQKVSGWWSLTSTVMMFYMKDENIISLLWLCAWVSKSEKLNVDNIKQCVSINTNLCDYNDLNIFRVSECGGVFTDPYGVIETPKGPTDYHNNHNCTWSITVQPDRVVEIKYVIMELFIWPVQSLPPNPFLHRDVFSGFFLPHPPSPFWGLK
jgi:hypothetical protein